MNGKKLNIGLFGFGTVGRGLYDVLQRIGTKNVEIKRICVRDINKPRAVEADFTDKADDIFNDPDINFIVELIDDAEAPTPSSSVPCNRVCQSSRGTRRCSHTISRSS